MAVERLSEEEIEERLRGIPQWRREGNSIVREFQTGNWKRTVFLFNTIAGLAEAHWHHPDVEAGFKSLKVKLTTHEAGGLTERDFRLAKEIEEVASKVLSK